MLHASALTVVVFGCTLGGPADRLSAKPPVERAEAGVEVTPLSIARVARVNGQLVLAGEWIPYQGGHTARGAKISTPFFDSFGREPGTAPPGGGYCGCPDVWYFGSEYHNPSTVEDMQDCACPPNSVVSEIDVGFFWCPSPSSGQNCILIYFPFEEVFDESCPDPATFTSTGSGVALNYGALPPGCPFYYYSRVLGLESLGVLSPATDDNGDANGFADGSYQMIIANAITAGGIVLAEGPCQPMLHGTSRGYGGSTGAGGCGPGLNNGKSIDMYDPPDPFSCSDYTLLLCPDPLGKQNCFAYLRCPADYNNDGFVDGIDSDQFNNDFESGEPCADLNGDCFVDGIDADYFNNEFESPC